MKIFAGEKNWTRDYFTKREKATASVAHLSKEARLKFDEDRFTFVHEDILTINTEARTAHIDISGPLSNSGPDWIDAYFGFGGTGYKEIIDALSRATMNPDVKEIILDMNTPGGHVEGVDHVHKAVLKAREVKPVIAINHGLIASAGYWIASAASKIYATSDTDETGSIGVLMVGYDFSKALEDSGILQVVIVSEGAENKVPDLKDPAGVQIYQDQVNAIERIFHKRVADGRGITVDQVKSTYGKGLVFIANDPDSTAPDAIKRKMIDGMIDAEENVKDDSSVTQFESTKTEATMTLEEMMAKDPGLKAQIEQRDQANVLKGREEAQASFDKRVKAATPFIANSQYGEKVTEVAVAVISGEQDENSLKGIVAYIDAQRAAETTVKAQAETETAPSVPPQVVITEEDETPKDGIAKNAAQYAAMMKKNGGQ